MTRRAVCGRTAGRGRPALHLPAILMIAIKITKEAGLITRGAFIFGDTQETLETAEYTMRWVEDHCDLLETAPFQPIVLYPGSELYERAVNSKKNPGPGSIYSGTVPARQSE